MFVFLTKIVRWSPTMYRESFMAACSQQHESVVFWVGLDIKPERQKLCSIYGHTFCYIRMVHAFDLHPLDFPLHPQSMQNILDHYIMATRNVLQFHCFQMRQQRAQTVDLQECKAFLVYQRISLLDRSIVDLHRFLVCKEQPNHLLRVAVNLAIGTLFVSCLLLNDRNHKLLQCVIDMFLQILFTQNLIQKVETFYNRSELHAVL
mmetsp:Transcript_68866/g.109323  ORF Transcript_68866/g.109323 Transcript_68866/m.109323 type:complete len:205 (+) Transcript_68866:19-633(+)